jgi:hypothetical protein
VAWNNGQPDGSTGVYAFSAANSQHVLFQYNEAYGTRSSEPKDGGGFGFCADVTDSVMQFNYAHGNDGAGFFLGGVPSRPSWRDVVRYNVSQDDARTGSTGIVVESALTSGIDIYNNTVYISGTADPDVAALGIGHADVQSTEIHVWNNVFYATGGAKAVRVEPGVPVGGLRFQGNDYHSDGALVIDWGDLGTFHSLGGSDGFRAVAGQEVFNGADVGTEIDPDLVAAGQGGTVGFDRIGHLHEDLTAYRLTDAPGNGVTQLGLNLFRPVAQGGLGLSWDPTPDHVFTDPDGFFISVLGEFPAKDFYLTDLPTQFETREFSIGANQVG